MLVISLLFVFVFLYKSFQAIIFNTYDWDLDQFMYAGSRILMGEMPWIKEFDDKSPVLHYIFAFPAFFKNLDVWIFTNIFLSFIAAFCLFSITNRLLNSTQQKKNLSYKISILTASIYLLFLSVNVGSLIHINIFCTNLIFISKYLLLKLVNNKNLKFKNKLILFIAASILSSVCISIRPYFFWAVLSIGVWITLRNFSFLKNQYNFNKLKIIKFSLIWIISVGILTLIFNFIPYIFTNNIDSFITTIKINSYENISNSPLQTLQKQYNVLISNPTISFPNIFLFVLIIFRYLFRKDLNIVLKNENLFKLDIDICFLSIVFPLLIEISILSRHFYGHYMTFFSGYSSISIGLFIGIFMKIFKNKYILRSQLVIIFLVGLFISKNILISPKYIFNNLDKLRDTQFGIIAKFIENERLLNKEINFLFPMNNYFHWKLSESRHGFPMAAVYGKISRGDYDGLFKKFPNLKSNYIMTDSERLCSALLDKGPELIITRNKGDRDEGFTYDCLQKSKKYDLDKSQDSLDNIDWFVFRSK